METNNRELYVKPSATVSEVKVEGIVCLSSMGGKTEDYHFGGLDEP